MANGLPLEVATLLADALNRALGGRMPAIPQARAFECLREASLNGVKASITYQPGPPVNDHPGRYMLRVDKIEVMVEMERAAADPYGSDWFERLQVRG